MLVEAKPEYICSQIQYAASHQRWVSGNGSRLRSAAADLGVGVLVECDPSIKSIIVNIDSKNHDFIIEDLDDQRLVVKENMIPLLKQKLEDRLKETIAPAADDSGSD